MTTDALREAAIDWLRSEDFAVFSLTDDEVPETLRTRVYETTDVNEMLEAMVERGDIDVAVALEAIAPTANDVKELARLRDVKLAEDCDWLPVLHAAAFVAFGSFAEWPDAIGKLREHFKNAGATSLTTAQFLLED